MWDADDVRERVRVRADVGPECRDNGARRHRWRLVPPVPEATVAGFEREHRCELPAYH